MKKIAIVLLLVVLLVAPLGCSASDPLTDNLYTTNIYNTGVVSTGSILYTDACWEEMVVPANEVGEGWPSPTASNCQSGYAYLFGDGLLPTDETSLHFTFQMPHSWKEGTDVIFNVRFIFNSDQVGTKVRWNIAYSWANVGDAFPVATNVWALSSPSNNDSLVHQTTTFDAIDGMGKVIGSMLMCYVSRNSSNVLDTYTDTAIFVSVSVLYQVDTAGSASEWSK